MNVDLKQTYHLTISNEELKLIMKALSGRLEPEEKEIALQLNVQLCELRVKTLADAQRWATQAAENAKKLIKPETQS